MFIDGMVRLDDLRIVSAIGMALTIGITDLVDPVNVAGEVHCLA